MVQSINTKVDYSTAGTSFHGLTTYGHLIVGDKGFEFFNDRNVRDYIQIPWEEVEFVAAQVMFRGKYIPRFSIETKSAGTFSFASREPKKLLRAIREYVGPNKMLKSLSFWDAVTRRFAKRK